MVKVFTENKNGKIEFTKDELEKLLNEVWNDGYYHHGPYWWASSTNTGDTIIRPITDQISVTCCVDMKGDADEN